MKQKPNHVQTHPQKVNTNAIERGKKNGTERILVLAQRL